VDVVQAVAFLVEAAEHDHIPLAVARRRERALE
jgi:hypothetical protein